MRKEILSELKDVNLCFASEFTIHMQFKWFPIFPAANSHCHILWTGTALEQYFHIDDDGGDHRVGGGGDVHDDEDDEDDEDDR